MNPAQSFAQLPGMIDNLFDKYRNMSQGQAAAGTGTQVKPDQSGQPFSTNIGGTDLSTELGKVLKERTTYAPKDASAYIPKNVSNAMNQNLDRLTNFKADPVRLSADHWNTVMEQTMAPMREEYDRMRSLTRGDLSAAGTLYDSEGYNQMEDLNKDYLTRVGRAMSDVQIARENEEAAGQKWVQEQNLAGLNAAAGYGRDIGSLYGGLGQKESELGVTTSLQDRAATGQLLGSGLDYLTGSYDADTRRYAAEKEAEASRYGYDVDRFRAEQDAADALRQRWLDYLGLPGYGDEDYFTAVGGALNNGQLNIDQAKREAAVQAENERNTGFADPSSTGTKYWWNW